MNDFVCVLKPNLRLINVLLSVCVKHTLLFLLEIVIVSFKNVDLKKLIIIYCTRFNIIRQARTINCLQNEISSKQ